jgi:hypothetical protein
MREPVRFQQSSDRVCRYVLNGIRVMPIVGLTCLWFGSVVSAQDARPAPSAATEDTRAPAAESGGSGPRAPTSAAPAAGPAAAAPRTPARDAVRHIRPAGWTRGRFRACGLARRRCGGARLDRAAGRLGFLVGRNDGCAP